MTTGLKINNAMLEAMKNAVAFNRLRDDQYNKKARWEQYEELNRVIATFEDKVNQPFGADHQGLLQKFQNIASEITLTPRVRGQTMTLANDFQNRFATASAQIGAESPTNTYRNRLDEEKGAAATPQHGESADEDLDDDISSEGSIQNK